METNYIDGSWVPAADGRTRTNVNPALLSDVVGEFAESSAADAEAAVQAAAAAFPEWRAWGPIRRADYLVAAGRLIAERAEEFAAAISREQGKLLDEARGEVRRSLAILDFTAGEARRLNGVTTPAEDPRTVALTFRRPIGVVALISPWNFPLAIPMWKVAPALLSGCAAVLKPSPLTPLTSALLVRAFADAGVPPGVLNLVQGDRAPGEALVAHSSVAGVSFTGSLPVGQAIQVACAPRLARTQLELGGKNALVVLADADLPAAADAIVFGAYGQAGQRCSATSRVVVDRTVKASLLELLRPRIEALTLGPVVNEERLVACLTAVEKAVAGGAGLVCGGRRSSSAGWFVEPTLLTEVPWDSELAQEEVFGPVLSVVDCDGFDDAIRIANSVRYGMSATIFTRDPSRMFEALDLFEAGMLHVNRPGVGAYAHLPHLGAKLSQAGAPECSPQVWDFYTSWHSACIAY